MGWKGRYKNSGYFEKRIKRVKGHMERIKILNSNIDNISMEEAVNIVENFINSYRPHQIVAVNAAKLVRMKYDTRLREIVNSSSLILPDGKSIVWASKILKRPLKERVTGIDLMEEIVLLAAKKGYRLYFLGARYKVIKKVVEIYKSRYPGICIAGWHDGYFEKGLEEKDVIEDIKSKRPHILFVGMESPFKEYWISENLNYLQIPVCMAVGGGFDVVGGFVRRAPHWMQEIGLEWFFRFLQEPKRLWKRYLYTNTLFIWLVLKEKFNRFAWHNLKMVFLIGIFGIFPFGIQPVKKIDSGWFSYSIPWNYCDNSIVDVSFLLDPPAGRHGFVIVKEGHFYFEDGTPARFWGVNIHSNRACFPTHRQAEDIAKRLSQLGCNLVRMHFLDNEAPSGIIDPAYNDSQHFSDAQMDRLDYFIHQLKKNGIYVTFDVLGFGVRTFKIGDDVIDYNLIKNGGAGISFFDKRIIELGKRYAKDLLTHINPYTGNAYIDEPAICMVEMSNENTIFGDWITSSFTPYYREEIQQLWKKWLIEKGYSLSERPYRNWQEDREFKFELQDNYQRDMYAYLRSIGVKCPIGSSNYTHDNLSLFADSHMDFTDIHPYWDHPYRSTRIHNRPLIMQSYKNPETIVNTIARAKVFSKPLVLTEWDSIWPNDWRAVDVLTTASYARLNDLDGLCLYAYNGGWGLSWDGLEEKIYYPTVVFNDPAKMGLFPFGALIFLRDAKPALNTYYVSYSKKAVIDMRDHYYDRQKLAGIMYISKLEKRFVDSKEKDGSDSDIDYPDLPSNFTRDLYKVISDTGEMIRDSKNGVFILDTARTVSFSGFVGRLGRYESDRIRIYTIADFATFTITSLDGKAISYSRHLLVGVVGRVRNHGQRLAPHETKKVDDLEKDVFIISKGDSPILVEGIDGSISVRFEDSLDSIEVYSLDRCGKRAKKIDIKIDKNWLSFDLSKDHRSIYYEILRK